MVSKRLYYNLEKNSCGDNALHVEGISKQCLYEKGMLQLYMYINVMAV